MVLGDTSVVGQNGDIVNYTSNFPAMGLQITPSIAQYRNCMERFQKTRMRYITAVTSGYAYSGTNAIQTSQSVQ